MPLDLVARVRFGSRPLSRPFRLLLGSAVTVTVEVLDAATLLPYTAAAVPWLTATLPDDSTETFTDALVADGAGRWALSLAPADAGLWVFQGGISAPLSAIAEAPLVVLASALDDDGMPDVTSATFGVAFTRWMASLPTDPAVAGAGKPYNAGGIPAIVAE